jgi:hypothetical protein
MEGLVDICYGADILGADEWDINMEVCSEALLGDCWYGWADEYGFIVGDEDMNGMMCDWYGNCLGSHPEDDGNGEHDFFVVSEEYGLVYPIQVDWIEDVFVDSVHSILSGYCVVDEEMSAMYDSEVFYCSAEDNGVVEEWFAGANEEGFGAVHAVRDEYVMCDWFGNCDFAMDGQDGCYAEWEMIEC